MEFYLFGIFLLHIALLAITQVVLFNEFCQFFFFVLILLCVAVLTVTQAILFNKCRQLLLYVEFCMFVVAVAGAEMSRPVQLSWSYHLITAPFFLVVTSATIIFSNFLCCCFNFILQLKVV